MLTQLPVDALLSAALLVYCFSFSIPSVSCARRPNVLLLVGDDVGWGDFSVYGHPTQEAGAIDRMAAEGIRFTQWYAAASFCTPSRASLLTGRYPFRTGLYGPTQVLLPGHSGGLPHDEVTIAEALKDFGGYTTGIVGKWHLGVNEAVSDDGLFLPYTHGFDYVGTILPFTLHWNCDTSKRHRKQPSTDWCILYRNSTIIEQPILLENLTAQLVFDAEAFIYKNQDRPFFLVVSFPQTHTPMFNHADFRGKSKRGIYGDQINEMSWAVGRILDVIKLLNLEQDTLALFISDHGPHVELCQEGGSAQPFREGKGYYGEGGLRIPAIAWWPGTISAGQVSSTVVSLLDVFPTLLDIAGIPLKAINQTIDGRSALSSLLGEATTPADRRILYFYCEQTLVAARVGVYKIYFRQSLFPSENRRLYRFCTSGGFPVASGMTHACPLQELEKWLVYNVEQDPTESWPVDVDQLLDAKTISRLTIALNSPLVGDVREPLLTRQNVHHSLVPCCNVPYCVCHHRQ